jgi:uncharacterized protein YaiL (DUF2058 family)
VNTSLQQEQEEEEEKKKTEMQQLIKNNRLGILQRGKLEVKMRREEAT